MLSLLAAALVVSLDALRRLGLDSLPARLGFGAFALGLGVAVVAAPAAPGAPAPIHAASAPGFATSKACRSCHPGQYDSWHRSYHRSMTEAATPTHIRAPWSGALSWRGQRYALSRRGDEFWVAMPDPDRVADAFRRGASLEGIPVVDRRVLMTTGSHHYQGYWVPGARGNELWQFPFVYHFESQRFIPRHDAFLQPETDPPYAARWNSNCIQCHSVAGEPRHDLATDRFESRSVELGIACEACHGPAAEHAARQRDPWVRERQRAGTTPDPDVVNPARLDARRASEVCGQCHSYFVPRDPERWWQSGFAGAYRPGDELERSRRLLDYAPGSESSDPELSDSLTSLFYADGTIRVGGREYNGLLRSACFTQGVGDRQLACTSCHQMHGGSRDDQLDADGESNAACSACHSLDTQRHTRHAPGSSGSQCVACHMPRTTYALFKSIRSHRITRPDVDRGAGAPLNACNACHQDRSLQWTARSLQAWADSADVPAGNTAPPETSGEAAWSSVAVAALRGDAAARVIAVAALGDARARAVSGRGWQAQVLAEALDDPYAAVRFVAARSLRALPGFEDLAFDFVAERDARVRQQALARERARAGAVPASGAPPLPMDERGVISPDVLATLMQQRDLRPIRIAE